MGKSKCIKLHQPTYCTNDRGAQLIKAEHTGQIKPFLQQRETGQINTASGRLHIAEAPSYRTHQPRRCCRVWGYQDGTRSTWTSNRTKLPIPPPVRSSLLSHQPRRSLKGKSSGWVTDTKSLPSFFFSHHNKPSSNDLSNSSKKISPSSSLLGFLSLSSLFIWAWWGSISITLISQFLFQGVT